jgi:hypothetical protein
MVEAGLITREQLAESLELQKIHCEKLASILVRQNHLTEKFAVTYLGRQLGVPGADLSKHAISLDLLHLVPLSVCRSRLVFPLRLEGGLLQLAMAGSHDEQLLAELAREHHVRLRPCIALEASIKNAVEEAAAAARAGLRSFTPGALHDRLASPARRPRRAPRRRARPSQGRRGRRRPRHAPGPGRSARQSGSASSRPRPIDRRRSASSPTSWSCSSPPIRPPGGRPTSTWPRPLRDCASARRARRAARRPGAAAPPRRRPCRNGEPCDKRKWLVNRR